MRAPPEPTDDRSIPSGPVTPLALQEDEIDLSDVTWGDGIVLVLFWVLAGVVFLQFFSRYVLNDSVAWTEEIARYFLIGVTFVGSVMATRKQSHIAVEFIYRWVPRPARRVAQTAIDIATTGFFAALTWYCAQIARLTGSMMVSIDVPKSLIYWIVAAAFACMTAHSALAGWRHLNRGTSRLIDPESHADRVSAVD